MIHDGKPLLRGCHSGPVRFRSVRFRSVQFRSVLFWSVRFAWLKRVCCPSCCSSFFIVFSMPSWLDFSLIFRPKLLRKNLQNRSKIDAKMHSILDSIFGSIFGRFLLPTSTPESQLNASRLAFSWFSASKVNIDF